MEVGSHIMKKTTWTIVGGCLEDVVTFQSSDSNSDSDSDSDVDHRTPPLILRRPSPDSGPCEITIDLTQQHDVKQIYIRSSARVYEVYSSSSSPSGNDYLCTVRCGIAAATDDDLQQHASDVDGWVDLHHPSAPHRFEATAEISDGDPVISLTLRLLSIHTRDYAFIDQLYVFAHPLQSPPNPSSPPSSSSGGAMLSMFLPTLMHLSNSRINTPQHHTASLDPQTKHSTPPPPTSTQLLPTMLHQSNHLLHPQNPPNRPHFSNTDYDFPCTKLQQSLDNLVSRVTKIEAFCLRFEQTMLNPIINMETRLERIEHQLDSSIKNLHLPRAGCTRYSAPEFSCNQSESDSICIVANDGPTTLKSESSKKDDCCPQESSIPNSDVHLRSFLSASQPLPGLIISAPQFSSNDEEEEINSLEEVKNSAKNLKKPMSIDDALASALAEFVTSASTKPIEHTTKVEGAETVSEAERSGSTSPSLVSTPLAKQLECTELIEEAEEDYLTIVSGDKETIEAVGEKKGVFYQAGSSDCSSADSLGETENMGSSTGIGCTESDNVASQASVSNSCDSLVVTDSALLKGVDSSSFYSSGEGIPKAYPAVLQDIMELPSAARVDFSGAVLDVKFSSLGNPPGKSSLESLLGDMLDLESEIACVPEEVASSANDQYDLVVIEYEGSGDVESVNNKLLYVDNYNSGYMPSETELQDTSNCSIQDMSCSLI